MAEIEVKLDAPAKSLAKVIGRPWLKRLGCGPVKRDHLVSIYYDTPKLTLRRAGVTLRVRRIGKHYVQTVKADPHGARGPFGKDEWETEIARRDPDLTQFRNTALDRFKRKKLKRRLRPIFATDVQRVAMPVRAGNSEIEIAFDRGEVKAGRKRAKISEIEIELKNGDPREVVKLAKEIVRDASARFGSVAKAERGYALMTNEGPQPVHAEAIELDGDSAAVEAFQVIALSCLRQVDGNRDAVGQGGSEGVHQMRVAVRRLRAAMSFFKELLRDVESKRIKNELNWLRDALGPARDLDVLIAEDVEPLRRVGIESAAIKTLKADLLGRRRRSFARAKAAIVSERYRRLVLDTALWANGGDWSSAADPVREQLRRRPVRDFADQEIARRHRKISKKLKKIEKLNPYGRHKLRIGAKKLRYADEFFASLYRGRGAKRLKQHRALLKQLQSALGKLNDLQVHDKMAHRLLTSRDRTKAKARESFAMGLISGADHAAVKPLMSSAEKAGRGIAAQRAFWD